MNKEVSFCEQVKSNALPSMMDNTDKKWSKSPEVSACEQVQASSIAYNTEGRICSEHYNHLYDRIRNFDSKGLDLDSCRAARP